MVGEFPKGPGYEEKVVGPSDKIIDRHGVKRANAEIDNKVVEHFGVGPDVLQEPAGQAYRDTLVEFGDELGSPPQNLRVAESKAAIAEQVESLRRNGQNELADQLQDAVEMEGAKNTAGEISQDLWARMRMFEETHERLEGDFAKVTELTSRNREMSADERKEALEMMDWTIADFEKALDLLKDARSTVEGTGKI